MWIRWWLMHSGHWHLDEALSIQFQAAVFRLTQPQGLRAFWKWIGRWEFPVFLCVSLFSLIQTHKLFYFFKSSYDCSVMVILWFDFFKYHFWYPHRSPYRIYLKLLSSTLGNKKTQGSHSTWVWLVSVLIILLMSYHYWNKHSPLQQFIIVAHSCYYDSENTETQTHMHLQIQTSCIHINILFLELRFQKYYWPGCINL